MTSVHRRLGAAGALIAFAGIAGCVQILGLDPPARGQDAGVDGSASNDDATAGDDAIAPRSDAEAQAPSDDGGIDSGDAASSGCASGGACTPSAACSDGVLSCEGGAPVCVAVPRTGCEGMQVCTDAGDGGCTCLSTCGGAACVNTSTDFANCGACGKSCSVHVRTGVCASSSCQPFRLPMPPGNPGVIVGLWAESGIEFGSQTSDATGIVGSIDLDDTNTSTFVPGIQLMTSFARDDNSNFVVWSTYADVNDAGTAYVPSTGTVEYQDLTSSNHGSLATGQNSPTALVIANGNVFWTNQGQSGAVGQVMKCAIAGCGGNPTVLASGQALPDGITADGTNVYWVNSGTGQIMQCPAAGCGGNPVALTTGLSNPTGIALYGGVLYVTVGGTSSSTMGLVNDGKVVSCPVTGCATPTVLADHLPNPAAIVTDGTTLYWANFGSASADQAEVGGGGSVMKCAIGGCNGTPTVLQTLVGPTAIETKGVDDFVTWGDLLGQIWVMPK